MFSKRTSVMLLASWLCAVAVPERALAAACCTSATSFGVGRLLIWEDFATGIQLGHARSLGQWNAHGALRLNGADFSDGLTKVEWWGILRLHERVQLQARVPVLLNDREVGSLHQVAGGVGDVAAGARVEVLSIGQYAGMPSFAFTAGVVAPTGRRVDQTRSPLFAGTTGLGAWGATLAIESEVASLPWFTRVDAGVTLFFLFHRADTGARERYGPVLQAAVSGGREIVADTLVVALALLGEWQDSLSLEGVTVPSSQAHSVSLSASASWHVDPHWTLVGAISNTVWPSGVGRNRDARLGGTLGVRYGFF